MFESSKKKRIFLVWSVSVIDYCDLGFIWNLVLGIWDLSFLMFELEI